MGKIASSNIPSAGAMLHINCFELLESMSWEWGRKRERGGAQRKNIIYSHGIIYSPMAEELCAVSGTEERAQRGDVAEKRDCGLSETTYHI